MKSNTKLYILLKFMYLESDKKFTAKQISEQIYIKPNYIPAYMKAMYRYVNKKKINGLYHYWLKPNKQRTVLYLLHNATKDNKKVKIVEKQVPVEKLHEFEDKYVRSV